MEGDSTATVKVVVGVVVASVGSSSSHFICAGRCAWAAALQAGHETGNESNVLGERKGEDMPFEGDEEKALEVAYEHDNVQGGSETGRRTVRDCGGKGNLYTL